MDQKLDPRAVLKYLNELGFQNITAHQLKSFIVDLKKLMKYEEAKNTRKSTLSDLKQLTTPVSTKSSLNSIRRSRFRENTAPDIPKLDPLEQSTVNWTKQYLEERQRYISRHLRGDAVEQTTTTTSTPHQHSTTCQHYHQFTTSSPKTSSSEQPKTPQRPQTARPAPSTPPEQPPVGYYGQKPFDVYMARIKKLSDSFVMVPMPEAKVTRGTGTKQNSSKKNQGTEGSTPTSTDTEENPKDKNSAAGKKRKKKGKGGAKKRWSKSKEPGKSALSDADKKSSSDKSDKKVQVKGRKSASPSPPGTPKKRISGPKRGKLSRLCECNIDDPALVCPHGFPWPTDATKDPPIGCYCCDKKTQTGPPGATVNIKPPEGPEIPPPKPRPKNKYAAKSSVIKCKHDFFNRRPKTDPIALYNYYRNIWATAIIPGEGKHLKEEQQLRWWIREKFACGPPVEARSYAIALMGARRCYTCRN